MYISKGWEWGEEYRLFYTVIIQDICSGRSVCQKQVVRELPDVLQALVIFVMPVFTHLGIFCARVFVMKAPQA